MTTYMPAHETQRPLQNLQRLVHGVEQDIEVFLTESQGRPQTDRLFSTSSDLYSVVPHLAQEGVAQRRRSEVEREEGAFADTAEVADFVLLLEQRSER